VTEAARENPDVPVWARNEAFPKSPPGWGWLDHKGRPHPCDSFESLVSAIRDDRDSRLLLAWTPEHANMILPEEVSGAAGAVLASRKRLAADDLLDSHDKLRWYGWLLGGLAAYMLYQGWSRSPGIAVPAERLGFALRGMLTSMSMGIALLMFLIFAFIPWYQARKRLREFGTWTADDVAAVVPVMRFETWLQFQKAPVTRLLLVLIGAVGLAQLLPGESIQAAGLVKPAYLQGEWWRLLTAPFLHGHPLHFFMNAAALIYLGKRIEVLARWPHVPLVFLFSACIGGEASARFVAAPSIGASGGLMGWLGFLLVFESLHAGLVPRSARRRLVAGVLLTGLIGLIGYRFIDNAAHAGGLIAGMFYALIVFPKSASPNRPSSTITDRIAGIGALAVLILAALFAVSRMMILGMR
jgi:membrane associated rhomboid family serine protease